MLTKDSIRVSYRLALMTGVLTIASFSTAVRAAPPIDTNQPFYLQSQVGLTVLPNFQGGTLRDDQNGVTDTNAYAVGSFPTNTIDAFGNKTTFSGVFSGTGPLNITDSVGGGAVIVTNASTIGGTVTINSGAMLQWGNGTGVPGYLIGGSGGVVNNGTLALNFGGGGLGGTNPISGSGNLLMMSGAFTEGGISTYTGATTINSGAILLLQGTGSIATSSGVANNGTCDISMTTSGASIMSLSGSGTVSLGAQTLTLSHASGIFSGVLADGGFTPGTGGALTIAAGTETLTGTNTYTGATTIDPGATLQLGHGGTTGTVAGNITDNGLLQFNYSGPTTTTGAISGSGSVEVVAGTTVVTNASNLGGTVTIDGGATLQWGNGNGTPGYLVGGSGGVVDNGTLAMNFGGGGLGGSNPISGSGNLLMMGGAFTEGGISTYTGATTINSGAILLLQSTGSIASSSGVANNGTFDISLTTSGASITSLSGSGTVSLGAQTLTLSNASGIFSGVLADGGFTPGTGGALTIAAGTETLTGTNTYTGATTIDPGATLQLGHGGTTGTVAGNITDNGLLQFNYSGPTTTTGAISGSGSVEVVAGTTVVTNASNLGGTVTIDSGATLQWGNGNGTPGYVVGGSGGVVNNGTLAMNFGGGGLGGTTPISGSGNLILQSGSLNDYGTSTYTGATTINSGALLLLSGTGSIAASSGVADNGTFDISGTTSGASITSLSGSGTVDLGARTLTLSNASGTFSGVLADGGFTAGTGGALTIAGGSQILTGTNTYTGATTINAGATLQLGNGGNSGSVAGNIIDNGTLSFNRSDIYILAGTLSGTGQLLQAGTGTTILNGVNSLSGQTTVSAGVLEVGDAGHAGAVLDTSKVIVGAAGTLAGHGTIVGAVANTSGGTVSPGGTIGTMTVGSFAQSAGSTLAIEVSPTAASRLNSLGQASLAGTLAVEFDPGSYASHIYTIVAGAPVTGAFSSLTSSGSPASGMLFGLDYMPTQVELVVTPAAPSQIYGGVSTATLDRAHDFANLLEDSFIDAGCAGTTTGKSDACTGANAWIQAVVNSDSVHTSGANFGFTNTSTGFLSGLDNRWDSGSTIGASFAYGSNSLSMGGASADASGSSYFGAIYGRAVVDHFWLDGQTFYMHSDWSVQRQVTGSGTIESSPAGNSEGVLLQASAPVHNGDLRPYLRVTYAQFERSAVTESGTFGFAVNSATNRLTVAEAGVQLLHSYVSASGLEIVPALQLGLQQAVGDRSRDIQASLSGAPGPAITVSSVTTPQTAGLVDGSLTIRLNQRVYLYTHLRGHFGDGQSDGAASLGGMYRF